MSSSPWFARGRATLLCLVGLLAAQSVFGLSLTYLIDGLVLGSLYGIIGVALILIYRTSRTINFAAGALGAVPAIVALTLDAHYKISYLAVAPLALFGGAAFGALSDICVMRWFTRSPRLIVTVVSIGLAQTLAIFAFYAPIWLGVQANLPPSVPTPWDSLELFRNSRGQPILTGNQLAAIVTVVLMCGGLAAFLRLTRMGIALRAAAQNPDRAALLGMPVLLIGTVAWAIAGSLSAMAIFVQAPLVGLPPDATLGFDTLLYALTAAVVARMASIGVALVAGMGIGVVIFGSVARTGDSSVASAIMVAVILVALLAQRGTLSRAFDAGSGALESVRQFRPIPLEFRGVPEVVRAKAGLIGGTVLIALAAPFIAGTPDLPGLAFLPIYGIVAVSLVVLTGWAGQISLGQFGLVGAGALASGGLIARHNIDFFAALGIGIAAGVLVALVIGLPAVRVQGLYLSVTTLAFGYAMQGYLLNPHYAIGRFFLPDGLTASIVRPRLYGRIDLEDGRSFYFVCVALLALTILAAYSFRRNRSGRVLIAASDNPRAASTYGVNLVRTRLAAFAVSGGMAGMAGVLIVYQQHQVVSDSFSVSASIALFLAVIFGGVTSVGFGVSGAVLVEFFLIFAPRLYDVAPHWLVEVIPLLLTGPLLILQLYFYRGGSAEWGFNRRDEFLSKVAIRRGLHVPSLVADSLVSEAPVDELVPA